MYIDNESVTTDLMRFGFIELEEAIKVLTAYKDNLIDTEADELRLMFNSSSGKVFLGDEHTGKSFVLDDGGSLSEWFYCEECNEEGFNFKQTEDLRNLCDDCYNNKKVNNGTE